MKRNDEYSHTEKKIINNLSQDYINTKEKKSRFVLLYENSLIHNKKMDLLRAKNFYNKKEKMIPVISKKAQEINRPKELFYKRLYNANLYKNNKISLKKNNKKKENQKKKETNEKNKNKTKSNVIIFDDSSVKNDDDNKNNKNDDNEEESLYIINDRKKNEEHKKLYKSPKKKSISFLFKPEINKKSKKIAEKIKTKSKERLLSLSVTEKNNLKNIMEKREIEKNKKLKEENEKKLFKENNNKYIPNVKNNKRKWIDNLYEKGIKSMREKEEKTKNEKLKKEKEYLQYSYSPIINRNSSYMNVFKRKNNTINTSKNLNNSKYKINNSDIYERHTKWKNLIEAKKNKLKNNLENKKLNDSDYCFSPNLNKSVMETDISFIGKNIIEYETFLDKYNYSKFRKKLDTINYKRMNIPPKQIYKKKLVVEFVSECDSNCQTNFGTNKLTLDKRPINEIHKNREKLKINDFFERNVKLQSNRFFKDNNKSYCFEYNNDYSFFDNNQNLGKDGLQYYLEQKNMIDRDDKGNLSFFNAVNSIINKID